MNKRDISVLIHFNFWADKRILTACEPISMHIFTQVLTPDPGWGSLRGILVHTLDAEYGWRSLLQAQDADEILQAEDFPDVTSLKNRWDIERLAWLDYLAGLSEDSIHQYYNEALQPKMTVWQTILHVVTHGIQHRGEAAAFLTGLGQSPGELDFDVFLEENPDTRSD